MLLNIVKKTAIIFVALLFSCFGFSQADSLDKLTVSGRIIDAETAIGIANLMVLNKTTGSGAFGKMDGSFSISIKTLDTLLIGGVGYQTQQLYFGDTVTSNSVHVLIELEPKVYELEPVTVLTERELDEIHADIQELGYDDSDYMLSGVDAISSPITFLYQMFSKVERSKRLVHEMENEDRKRELLKELFIKYVKYDIIDLDDEEFDDFIDFIQVPEEFMKVSSQYDFIIYIKSQYDMYSLYNR